MVAAHRAENVDTGRRLDLLGERDDRTRQLRHEAGNPPALTTAVVDDGDPIDIDIVDRRHDLVDELREHVEHEDALAVITSSLVLLRETLEHLDLRLAVLDDLRRLRLSGELLGFEVGLGGRDDISLETATLQLDALLLEGAELLGMTPADLSSSADTTESVDELLRAAFDAFCCVS